MKRTSTQYLFKINFFLLMICCLLHINSKAQTIAAAYHREPVVYVNLMLPSADSLLLVDGTAAMYNNKFSSLVDQYDAAKLANFLENICLQRNGKNLAIEARPMPDQNDTLFINMWGLRKPVYTLQVSIKGVPSLIARQAWLVDDYLHVQTPISFFDKTSYSFSFNSDKSSYTNRFLIVFSNGQLQSNTAIAEGNVKVFPNPVHGDKITLQFSNMAKNNYEVRITNLTGNIIFNGNILHNGGTNTYYLPLNSVYKGIYTVMVSSGDTKKTIHLPVILNN